jgi:hypothetical protein
VLIIEQEIFKSLTGNESSKSKTQNPNDVAQLINSIKSEVPGNGFCVDCDAPDPEWASLNLGILMCIECSGAYFIHSLLSIISLADILIQLPLYHKRCSSQLGISHFKSSFVDFGRMATGSFSGDAFDRKLSF